VLYKTWADRPGVYIDTLCLKYKKIRMKENIKMEMLKNKSKCTYVYIT
jgi:hypothetical protein